jgi:hypothetical protein
MINRPKWEYHYYVRVKNSYSKGNALSIADTVIDQIPYNTRTNEFIIDNTVYRGGYKLKSDLTRGKHNRLYNIIFEDKIGGYLNSYIDWNNIYILINEKKTECFCIINKQMLVSVDINEIKYFINGFYSIVDKIKCLKELMK